MYTFNMGLHTVCIVNTTRLMIAPPDYYSYFISHVGIFSAYHSQHFASVIFIVLITSIVPAMVFKILRTNSFRSLCNMVQCRGFI